MRKRAKYEERLDFRVTLETAQRIDEWRRQQPDIPTRQEAVRRLLDKALESEARNEQA